VASVDNVFAEFFFLSPAACALFCSRRKGRWTAVASTECASARNQFSEYFLTIIATLYKLHVMDGQPNLNVSFAALSDPTRRAILARLALGEATVMELAEPFEMTQPAISQHLKVLEEAGLIVQRVDGTKRPRRLAKAGIEAMDQWLAMLRRALEKNYNRLDDVLAAMEPNRKGKR
jgi:DNA-binding transcriptional ArsR family regulator